MRRSLPILASLILAACTGEPEPGDASAAQCDDAGATDLVVVQQLIFVRETDGVVPDGFDLDGDEGSGGGCGVVDYTTEEGEPGIDNAFAGLLPALELTEAAAVESLVAQAIADGDLLIALEQSEVDDPMNDACIDLTVGRATGTPMLGTDGLLLSGQTFDRDPEAPDFSAPDVALVAGELEAPLELDLPLQVFEIELEFRMNEGRIRAHRRDDGTVYGTFAGSVDVQELLTVAAEDGVMDVTYDVLSGLLAQWSDMDLDGDGACEQLSIGFEFEAVPAFWFE